MKCGYIELQSVTLLDEDPAHFIGCGTEATHLLKPTANNENPLPLCDKHVRALRLTHGNMAIVQFNMRLKRI